MSHHIHKGQSSLVKIQFICSSHQRDETLASPRMQLGGHPHSDRCAWAQDFTWLIGQERNRFARFTQRANRGSNTTQAFTHSSQVLNHSGQVTSFPHSQYTPQAQRSRRTCYCCLCHWLAPKHQVVHTPAREQIKRFSFYQKRPDFVFECLFLSHCDSACMATCHSMVGGSLITMLHWATQMLLFWG